LGAGVPGKWLRTGSVRSIRYRPQAGHGCFLRLRAHPADAHPTECSQVGHDFFLFRDNADGNALKVLYRRK